MNELTVRLLMTSAWHNDTSRVVHGELSIRGHVAADIARRSHVKEPCIACIDFSCVSGTTHAQMHSNKGTFQLVAAKWWQARLTCKTTLAVLRRRIYLVPSSVVRQLNNHRKLRFYLFRINVSAGNLMHQSLILKTRWAVFLRITLIFVALLWLSCERMLADIAPRYFCKAIQIWLRSIPVKPFYLKNLQSF